MGMKKSKEYRFTFQDSAGKLRVVHLQAQHMAEEGQEDRIVVHVTTDGVPLEMRSVVDPVANRTVKTESRM